MGVKHTVLPDGQPLTVAVIALVQLCGPKGNETAMGATQLTRMVREGTSTLYWFVRTKGGDPLKNTKDFLLMLVL